jgi:hypothetical protein
MEKLGDTLVNHFDGIAAYCDRPVRFISGSRSPLASPRRCIEVGEDRKIVEE